MKGPTREELMAGLITVNGERDERKDYEAIAQASTTGVDNGGSRRETTKTGDRGGGIPDVPPSVHPIEEAVEDYLARQEVVYATYCGELSEHLQECKEKLANAESKLSKIRRALNAIIPNSKPEVSEQVGRYLSGEDQERGTGGGQSVGQSNAQQGRRDSRGKHHKK